MMPCRQPDERVPAMVADEPDEARWRPLVFVYIFGVLLAARHRVGFWFRGYAYASLRR